MFGCVVHIFSNFSFPSSRVDIADCSTSVYHKVSNQTEVGLSSSYNLHTGNVGIGLVGKYILNDGAILKVNFFFPLCLSMIFSLVKYY